MSKRYAIHDKTVENHYFQADCSSTTLIVKKILSWQWLLTYYDLKPFEKENKNSALLWCLKEPGLTAEFRKICTDHPQNCALLEYLCPWQGTLRILELNAEAYMSSIKWKFHRGETGFFSTFLMQKLAVKKLYHYLLHLM